jgi:prophage regulatory protein
MSQQRKPTSISALLPMREAQAYFGNRSRQWFYNKLKNEPTFPRPVKTGAHTIAWIRTEVDAWVIALPRAAFDGLSAVARKQIAKERLTRSEAKQMLAADVRGFDLAETVRDI